MRRSLSSLLAALPLPLALLTLLTACGGADSAAADSSEPDAVVGGAPGAGGAHDPADAGTASGGQATGGGEAGAEVPPTPDAGLNVPDLAPPPTGDACEAACTRVGECVTETCGADPGFAAEAGEACRHECAANPSFSLQVADLAACPDVMTFAATAVGAPLANGCPSGSSDPTHHAVCDVFGERFATCIVGRCPAAAEQHDLFLPAYTRFCDDAANRGEFDPEQLGRFLQPDSPCDSPIFAGPLDDAVAEGSTIHAFCNAGAPLIPRETCEAGCAVAAPCLESGGAYGVARDPLVCTFLCVATESIDADAWACEAALEADATCDAALACLDPNALPPGPLPECSVYGARVAACALEQCPGLAEVTAGATLALAGACEGWVRETPERRPEFQAITADTPCDDPNIGPLVTALVVDSPDVPDDGAYAALCQSGPLNPIESLCRPACAVIAPCLPEEGDLAPLRDPAACEFYCAQAPAEVPADAWPCFAEAASCPDAFACAE